MTTVFQQGRKPSTTRYLVYPAFRWTLINHTRLKLWSDSGSLTVYRSSALSTAPAHSNTYVPASLTRPHLDPCYYIILGRVTTEINRTTGPTSWSAWRTVRWSRRRIMRWSINSRLRIFLSLEAQPFTSPRTMLTEGGACSRVGTSGKFITGITRGCNDHQSR